MQSLADFFTLDTTPFSASLEPQTKEHIIVDGKWLLSCVHSPAFLAADESTCPFPIPFHFLVQRNTTCLPHLALSPAAGGPIGHTLI